MSGGIANPQVGDLWTDYSKPAWGAGDVDRFYDRFRTGFRLEPVNAEGKVIFVFGGHRRRLDMAREVWDQATGDGPRYLMANERNRADVEARGFPADRVIYQRADSTTTEAYALRNWMDTVTHTAEPGVIPITDLFHLPRAIMNLQRHGMIWEDLVPWADYTGPEENQQRNVLWDRHIGGEKDKFLRDWGR